jgi:hypothetical protein
MRVRAVLLCTLTLHTTLHAQSPAAQPGSELDAFMEKALARREHNRLTLQRYVLDEEEEFELLGPGHTPLLRQHREFTWYVRDGLQVRSPVRFNGVGVGDRERSEYEERWAGRERERLAREKEKRAGQDAPAEPDDPPEPGPSGAAPIPTPRFVSEAYFMEFKFEPGNYYLAGRETLEGKDVLRIEYYPQRMFSDNDDESKKKKEGRDAEFEQRLNRQMNKTALITLWVDPAEHQIVKYTFDNVWMDFLPGKWLVRIDEIRASMTMGQPFPGVWLPREIGVNAGVTLANGSFDAAYARKFANYKLADVKTKIRVPKSPEESQTAWSLDPGPWPLAAGPFVEESAQRPETVAEIRVHGNAFIPDEDIIRLAGVAIGQPVDDPRLTEIERRLKASGRFESVEVRKRYRSLTNMSEVSVLLVVHERPGITTTADDTGPVASTWRRLKSRFMFLPVLTYSDGYGFTYGGRVSTVNMLGMRERVSVPLTWGGTRRAAIEVERTFERGPLTRLESSFGIWRRENPHYDLGDRRVDWSGRAERHFARILRTGVNLSTSSVRFGTIDDRLWTVGADAALDTRADPRFPRNAVYFGTGWTGLRTREQDDRVNRYVVDARGYAGLIGQAVLAARAQFTAADAPLPLYERLLLGGSATLRGFRTGTFSGDRLFVTSAEIRVPITSVLNNAKFGVTGFFDAAKAYDFGTRFEDADWHRAAGGGIFLIASIVQLNLDVAHGFRDGDTRVHLGMGFGF